MLRCIAALLPLLAFGKAEILWDKFGVPHIFATSTEAMFHAHGYAQMQNHADLLLKLYGQSRGRAAEYWGEENLALDRWVRVNGVPERAIRDTAGSLLAEFAAHRADAGRSLS